MKEILTEPALTMGRQIASRVAAYLNQPELDITSIRVEQKNIFIENIEIAVNEQTDINISIYTRKK